MSAVDQAVGAGSVVPAVKSEPEMGGNRRTSLVILVKDRCSQVVREERADVKTHTLAPGLQIDQLERVWSHGQDFCRTSLSGEQWWKGIVLQTKIRDRREPCGTETSGLSML